MTDATTAANASRNGHGEMPGGPRRDAPDGGDGTGGILGRMLRGIAGAAMSRVPAADLDERDPDYIRESLPGIWLLASIYFRGEVRGLGNIPEDGPVLLDRKS